jgi:hypothetical protein
LSNQDFLNCAFSFCRVFSPVFYHIATVWIGKFKKFFP